MLWFICFILGVSAMNEEEQKQWICGVCGYVHTGDTPPEKCPRCGKSAEVFKEKTESCDNCK